jgi:site-specific DNA-methyltransferase (adenine-specific)
MSAPKRLPRNQILIGDARTHLAGLPDNSIDSVITSPPYFALRDYGHAGQLGLEPSVDEWVRDLVAVCDEIRRVLKPTGSFWLNVGDSYSHSPKEGTRKKSLLLAPQRLALALAARGWIIRNHAVWAKTNPMPSNVTDRLSNTHESIYFLTGAAHYYFDLNAIREPHKDERVHGSAKATNNGRIYPPPYSLPRRDGRNQDINTGLDKMKQAGVQGHPLGKNPGDVWQMGTAAYHGDHFATFPAKLVERPLLATCPERTCTTCGAPWQRAKQFVRGRWLRLGKLQAACDCHAGWQPGVVLDPFMGSGTVALVAEQHRRDWVGVELNPAYAALTEQRLADWRARQRREG